MNTKTIDSVEDFDNIVLSSPQPIVVDFWAEWCGPCHALAPILEEATQEAGLQLVKVDVDAQVELAARYGIMSIPAVLTFRSGAEQHRFVGVKSKKAILADWSESL